MLNIVEDLISEYSVLIPNTNLSPDCCDRRSTWSGKLALATREAYAHQLIGREGSFRSDLALEDARQSPSAPVEYLSASTKTKFCTSEMTVA